MKRFAVLLLLCAMLAACKSDKGYAPLLVCTQTGVRFVPVPMQVGKITIINLIPQRYCAKQIDNSDRSF